MEVNIFGCSECRLHRSFNPPVWCGCVFSCKVHPPLPLEQFSGIVSLLVGGEQGERSQTVRIQAPLLHQAPRAQRPDVLSVDLHQVLQDHGHQLLLAHPLEERGVVGAGVRSQEGSCRRPGEAVAGVVDEARGAVCDALPSSDALFLPEAIPEAEYHLGGAGVVNGAQGLHLVRGEGGLEVNEEGGLRRRCNQGIVHSQVGQGAWITPVLERDRHLAAACLVDELDLGVEEDGGVQQLVESPRQVLKAVCHFKVPGRNPH